MTSYPNAPAPPGLWEKAAVLTGIGLDGNVWTTTYNPVTGKWDGPVRVSDTPVTLPSPPLLGIYTASQNSTGDYPAVWADSHVNIVNVYQAWTQPLPAAFMAKANAANVTVFLELEPWHMGPSWNETPAFADIINGKYDSWLRSVGTLIAQGARPVILTFAHEFNVSGQYPWAQGMSGNVSPAQWIDAWNHVRSVIRSVAGGHDIWMWCPNVWTGGTTTDPSPYWPGNADMIGVDGYPDTKWGASLGTFAGMFGPVFTAIQKYWSDDIFISETNLAQMVSSGGQSITAFVQEMFAAGGSGILEFDLAGVMTSAQWAEYDAAVTTYGPK